MVVVDPLDPVVGSDSSHGFRKRLGLWHQEVVEDWNYVASGRERASHLFVDPVPLLVVAEAAVKGS